MNGILSSSVAFAALVLGTSAVQAENLKIKAPGGAEVLIRGRNCNFEIMKCDPVVDIFTFVMPSVGTVTLKGVPSEGFGEVCMLIPALQGEYFPCLVRGGDIKVGNDKYSIERLPE